MSLINLQKLNIRLELQTERNCSAIKNKNTIVNWFKKELVISQLALKQKDAFVKKFINEISKMPLRKHSVVKACEIKILFIMN